MFETPEQLMSVGKYREALSYLRELSAGSLGIVDDLKCRRLISDCLRSIGEYTESLNLSQQLIDNSESLSESYWIQIDAMIQKSHAMLHLNRFDEALENIELTTALLDTYEVIPRKAKLLRLKGWIKLRQGHTDEALECAERAMDIGEETEDLEIIAYSCQLFGAIYSLKCDFNRALEYSKRGLQIREHQGHKPLTIDFHNNIGALYTECGKLDLALQHYKESQVLIEESGDTARTAVNIGNIGFVHYLLGDLDKALDFTEQSLNLARESNDRMLLALRLVTIGRIYRELGSFDMALDFLENGLKFHNEIGMALEAFQDIFELVVTAIESNSIDEANEYLARLRNAERNLDAPWTEGVLDLAEALVLKTKGRTRDQAKIEELLFKVAYRETMSSRFRILALLNLCGLLMEQLRESEDPEFLQEVRAHLGVLSEIAKSQSSTWLLVESVVLESKLALLESDFREARRLLTRAQRIAGENGLGRLVIKISNEHDRLLDAESNWSALDQESKMNERIEFAKIDEQFSEMFRRGLIEESELPEEEPVMVMLLSEGGLCFYSKTFAAPTKVSEHMIAGFLNAIQGFTDEIFSQSLDRIKLESYTLLVRPEEPFTYCYVFKGQSYTALQKLSKFIEIIPQKPGVWLPLLECIETKHTLDSEIQASLDCLIEEVFLAT